MSKIPPELENLMWTLAESDNPQAVSEFEARFPQLRIELAKRTSMVRSLRSTRPGNVTTPSIPRFVPGPAAATTEPTRAMYIAAFVFAAIAMSVFAFTAVLTHHPRPEEPAQQTVARNLPAQSFSNPIQPQQPSTPKNEPTYTAPTQPPQQPANHGLASEPPIIDPPAEHAWEKPQTITMKSVPLQTALQAIADEGHLTLDIAPGLPNPTVSVDYQNQSVADILKDMGHAYAFTAMLSEDGSALIIPAVAPTQSTDKFAKLGSGQ